MCGINGVIYKNQKSNLSEINNMNTAIKHRGPDDDGLFAHENVALGHVRLSILDLSKKGKQPMTCDNRFWISYNGEVYNFKEIRNNLIEKGYKFFSATDTEVILKSYIEWGDKCFEKFNGMWALAILDKKKKQLIISRDRYGVKPCYYFLNKNKFIFSSEIKGILSSFSEIKLDKNKLLLSVKALEKHFTTYYEDINILPPGNIFKIDINNLNISKLRWWRSIDNLSKIELNYNKSKEEIKNLLYEATKLRLVSDTKISTSLSGGIDSGVIFAILNSYSQMHNLSLDPFINKNNNITFKNAVELSKFYNRKPVIINETKFDTEDFTALFASLEQPTNYFNQINIYKKQKENGFKISIDGHGADECLGGYARNIMSFIFQHHNFLADTYQSYISINGEDNLIEFVKKYKFASKVLKYHGINYAKDYYKNISINHSFSEFIEQTKKIEVPEFFLEDLNDLSELNYDQQSLLVDANYGTLQWLLNKWDRASMSSSVEIRSPYLDWNFFQYAISLPNSFKIKNGKNKSILRDAFTNILSPSINNDFRKQGLQPIDIPFDHKYISHLEKIFNQESFVKSNLWNGKKIKNKFEIAKNNNDLESIQSLDILSKIYLMDIGFKNIKKNNHQNKKRIVNNYNFLKK